MQLKRKTTLTAMKGGSLLAEGFLRAPCFCLCLLGPLCRVLTPGPVPKGPAFPPIYPRRAAPHQLQWKDPCLPSPKSREITLYSVFPTL